MTIQFPTEANVVLWLVVVQNAPQQLVKWGYTPYAIASSLTVFIVLRISKGVVNPAAYQYFLHVVTYKVQTYDVTYGVISATYQLSTSAVHLNVNIFAPPLVWMIDEPTRLP